MGSLVPESEITEANDLAAQETPIDAESPTVKRRSFKGMSLEVRQAERRERLMEAGLQAYGTQGFFSVTVRDVCVEAKLTERYFYESFKNSSALFDAIYIRLVEDLQQRILNAMMQGAPDPKGMISLGLSAFFQRLSDDHRVTRILFIDAILVHEDGGKSIHKAVKRFDVMTQSFITLMIPQAQENMSMISLISTGLTGYSSHLATRWAITGFKESVEEMKSACMVLYEALFTHFQVLAKTSKDV
ncbi:MAG: TetR/AcrR family transcriptional regulator [Aquirhabdus sp.]